MTDEAVVQILKAINDFREEFRDEKNKNEKRWEENEKCWEENQKLWIQNERNRKRDRDELKDIIWPFQTSVEHNEKRIDNIEKICPKCKVKVV